MGISPTPQDLALLSTVDGFTGTPPLVSFGLQGRVVETSFVLLDDNGEPLTHPEEGLAGYSDTENHGWVWVPRRAVQLYSGFYSPGSGREAGGLPAPPAIPRLSQFGTIAFGTHFATGSDRWAVEPSRAFSRNPEPVLRVLNGGENSYLIPTQAITALFLDDATYG